MGKVKTRKYDDEGNKIRESKKKKGSVTKKKKKRTL